MMTGVIELAIFVGLVYWFFNDRATVMVGVIKSKVLEYVDRRQRSLDLDVEEVSAAGGQRLTQAALRRAALHHRRRQLVDRGEDKLMRERNMYVLKEIPTTVTVNPIKRPIMGLSCKKCNSGEGLNANSLVNTSSQQQSVINILKLGHSYNENNGFLSRTFCDFIHNYKAQKYDYQQVSETVMNDERLKQALDQITQETLEKQEADAKNPSPKDQHKKVIPLTSVAIYKKNEKRARSILKDMRSTISDFLLRLTSWTLYKLLPYFVKSVDASPAQLDMLKRAGDMGLPLIFIPLHRSHLDYILVSFILLNYNIRCPLVAAGDNLKIPLFGWLLRGLGAFYIKRRMESSGSEKDTVYRAALHTYMMHCLRARHNIEFFIEGGRSRTGKPQLPKGGILSVIVDAYLDGTIEDALLVPVSMNYEKLVDGNFVREQLGMPKQMETFGAAMKAIWKVLNSHYGSLRIDFNQPFSVRELAHSFNNKSSASSNPLVMNSPLQNGLDYGGALSIRRLSMERSLTSPHSCSSLYGTDGTTGDQEGLVEAIARHVVYDCTQATAVMSTNAVAFLLLTQFREGCPLDVLAAAVGSLTKELNSKGQDVGYSGEPIDVVNHAINILGPGLVLKERDAGNTIVKAVSILPNIIELAYYGNTLLPYYAMQSIVVTALECMAVTTVGGDLWHSELVDMSLQLCEVLSQEFILCKPCQDLKDCVEETIGYLISTGLLYQKNMGGTDGDRRYIYLDDDDEHHVVVNTFYKLSEEPRLMIHRRRLLSVLRPLIELYGVTILSLPRLLASDNGFTTISEAEFVQDVLVEMKLLLDTGDCKYGESLSTDGIKNCIKLLRLWGVVNLRTEGRQRLLSIAKSYDTPGKLKSIHDLVFRFQVQLPAQEASWALSR